MINGKKNNQNLKKVLENEFNRGFSDSEVFESKNNLIQYFDILIKWDKDVEKKCQKEAVEK